MYMYMQHMIYETYQLFMRHDSHERYESSIMIYT